MNEQEAVRTYWNGIPTLSYQGTAIIADAPEIPQYWAKEEGIIGQRIPVVRVVLEGVTHNPRVIYLDDRGGVGWFKVTSGRGLPSYGHAYVTIETDSFEGSL